MKHLKSYNEGFLDYFKKDSSDDKITLDMIHRLEKVKDKNPYEIDEIMNTGTELPSWMGNHVGDPTPDNRNDEHTEYFSKIYLVRFDDVDIVITNDRHGLIYTQTGAPAGYEKCKNPWKFFLGSDVANLSEKIKSKESYRKKLFQLVDKIYNEDKERKRIDRIQTEINPAADLIDESIYEREVVFTNKRNPRLVITIKKNPDGRITEIENETGMRFPFSVGQLLQRNVEVWACNNNFLMDGKDTCPDKKIFGVKTKDVPQGHEWRHIFPHKF
jgi:hypothetical protein